MIVGQRVRLSIDDGVAVRHVQLGFSAPAIAVHVYEATVALSGRHAEILYESNSSQGLSGSPYDSPLHRPWRTVQVACSGVDRQIEQRVFERFAAAAFVQIWQI